MPKGAKKKEMAKLTKVQRKAHEQAEAILTKDKLADWER